MIQPRYIPMTNEWFYKGKYYSFNPLEDEEFIKEKLEMDLELKQENEERIAEWRLMILDHT